MTKKIERIQNLAMVTFWYLIGVSVFAFVLSRCIGCADEPAIYYTGDGALLGTDTDDQTFGTDTGDGALLDTDTDDQTFGTDTGDGALLGTDTGDGALLGTDTGDGALLGTDTGDGALLGTDTGDGDTIGTAPEWVCDLNDYGCDHATGNRCNLQPVVICALSLDPVQISAKSYGDLWLLCVLSGSEYTCPTAGIHRDCQTLENTIGLACRYE